MILQYGIYVYNNKIKIIYNYMDIFNNILEVYNSSSKNIFKKYEEKKK